jgi:hypothetical protein
MNQKLRSAWAKPWAEKWGRLGLLLLAVLPIFLFFIFTNLDSKTDNTITLGISLALALGVAASIATTQKYYARSLGLLAAISGSSIYFFFLFLFRSDRGLYYWLSDLTRALFVVGAPIFAVTTVAALIQRTRQRRNERHAASLSEE